MNIWICFEKKVLINDNTIKKKRLKFTYEIAIDLFESQKSNSQDKWKDSIVHHRILNIAQLAQLDQQVDPYKRPQVWVEVANMSVKLT